MKTTSLLLVFAFVFAASSATAQLTLVSGDFETPTTSTVATQNSVSGLLFTGYNNGPIGTNISQLGTIPNNFGGMTDNGVGNDFFFFGRIGGTGNSGFTLFVENPTPGTYTLQFDIDVFDLGNAEDFSDNSLVVDIVEWDDEAGSGNPANQMTASESDSIGANINGNGAGLSPNDSVTRIDLSSHIQTPGTEGFETISDPTTFTVNGWDNLAIRFYSEGVNIRSDAVNREAVFIDNVQVIPEPSTYAAMFGVAVLVMAWLRRRR